MKEQQKTSGAFGPELEDEFGFAGPGPCCGDLVLHDRPQPVKGKKPEFVPGTRAWDFLPMPRR